jgi:two-component system sensor histidine kinase PilS (NtrC family)
MNPQDADRRSGDRRRTDRRARAGRRREDSIYGPTGGPQAPGDFDSVFDAGWLASGDVPSDSRQLLRQVRRIAQAQDSALSRVYRTYGAARAAIGVGLVASQGASSLLGTRNSEWLVLISLLYAVQAITLWLLPRFGPMTEPQAQLSRRRRQWVATIGIDLVAFAMLHLLEVGASFNYAALLVLPVLMAGVLTPRLMALGTSAAVSLILLLAAWRAGLGGAEVPVLMLQSGLAGLGMFVITLMAGELAGRLAREELAARGSLELARQQAQLNRLVIEEMADGVLVVDRRLRVRAANPAARALLVDQGLGPQAPFTLQQRPSWLALLQAVERALTDGEWPDAGRDVMLSFGAGHTRTLRVRVRFMRGRNLERGGVEDADGLAEPFAVLLLEDLRTLQARIRQEKLAAMGRVSVGIAHEIRNPLAAIAQANALLLEDDLDPAQQRLATMVADNVQRLKRLVDDVMELAPGLAPDVQPFDAASAVASMVADWSLTANIPLGPESRLRTELPATPLGLVFDPEHLRRVLVNLLDNAQRHASPLPGAIFLRLAARDEAWAVLSVLSDGPAIAPDVERYLFEPFFSTRSRGSGLGLYICRELCERYGASIEYRPRLAAERLRNEFVVSLRRVSLLDPVLPDATPAPAPSAATGINP